MKTSLSKQLDKSDGEPEELAWRTLSRFLSSLSASNYLFEDLAWLGLDSESVYLKDDRLKLKL